MALVGEAGPELLTLPGGAMVRPFSERLDVSGNININITGNTAGLSTELLADVVSERLIDTIKQEGLRRWS